MDDIVLRGMAKWPDVPAVYGWLALDRRGNWLIRGERIANPLVADFIGRNYAADARGGWFFQNGPQRVFVALEYAPFVLRASVADGGPLALETHTGKRVARPRGAWMDEDGVVLLETEHGPGAVHDHDVERLVPQFVDAHGEPLPDEALEVALEQAARPRAAGASLWLNFGAARLPLQPIARGEVAQRLGFVPRPEPAPGEDACR